MNIKHLFSILFLAATLLAARTLYGQITTPTTRTTTTPYIEQGNGESFFGLPAYGLFVGYSRNYISANGLIWTQCPTCGNFGNGSGGGVVIGGFGELPMAASVVHGLSAYLGVTYAGRGGNFTDVNTGGLPILDPNTNTYVTLERQSAKSTTLSFLVGDLGLKFQPIDQFPIYLLATLNASLPFSSSSSFTQTEHILSPQGVVYPETGTTTRTVATGTIQGMRMPFGAAAGLGYPFPLGGNLTAAPELRYYLPFSSVVPADNWKIRSLEFGVAVRYKTPEPPPPPPPPPPPVVEKKPEPKPPVAVLATVSSPHVSIIETIVTETFPVLPYLFFDSASNQLADRYITIPDRNIGSFAETDLPHQSLDAYYNILNVVGSRMAKDTSYRITLNGTTDGEEVPAGNTAKELAQSRAQRMKDYLVKTWSVDPNRIEVTTSDAPEFPSTTEFPEGIAENRRVELSSDNDEILRPILHERFKEHVVDPPSIPFTAQTKDPANVANWQMTASVRGKTVWQTSGTGAPPTALEWKLDHANTAKLADALSGNDSLHCELRVTSKDGLSTTTSVNVPGKKSVNPFELSRLSLIVFDFDKSDITEQNQRMISHFVAHSILDSSKSTIIGSTDNLGEEKHNQTLSEGRAFAVRDLILADRPNTQILKTEGVGSNRQAYPNSLPEGRYYCRTVTVEVETPLSAIKE